jgi:Ice-binding-like
MSGKPRLVSLVILMAALIVAAWPAPGLAATQPRLGTALNFAVLAGSAISNTGPSVITGNLGISPGNASSVTGFPPGTVTGAQNTADAVALQAQTDLVTAYTDAATATSTSNLTGQDLGGMNLTPGVYTFSTSAQLTGALTLSGNGVFIFQIGSTLTTASASSVLVAGGAQACAIFWQVGTSATLGLTTQFQGNLMALSDITMNTGANILTGRALARNGALTLDTNQITPPSGVCTVAAPPTPTPVASPTPGVSPSPTPGGGATPSPTQVVGLPNTGGPPQSPGFPWLPVVIAGTIGAVLLGLRVRTDRRKS